MSSFRTIQKIIFVLGLATLLIVFTTRLQAWQPNVINQIDANKAIDNFSTLATSITPTITTSEGTVISTTYPPELPVNPEGTPYNPFLLTPILTVPVINAEGTPLTPTPNQDDFLDATPIPMPTSTLITKFG
jgi:hypothetical protein